MLNRINKTLDDALKIKPKPLTLPSEKGQRIRIKLLSGGSLEFLIDVDLFTLSEDDSKFVRDIIDKFRGYSKGR